MRIFLFLLVLCTAAVAQTGLTTQSNRPGSTPLRVEAQSSGAQTGSAAVPAAQGDKGAQVRQSPEQLAAQVPPPRPADVASPQSLLAATYDVISGPPGPRDWNRFRSLFLPTARLNSAAARDGKNIVVAMSVQDYIDMAGAVFLKKAFFERPIVSRFDTFRRMAQVYSSYESASEKGGKPFARGINSFQMLFDGKRWWVASISWTEEDATHPLPPDMAAVPNQSGAAGTR